MELLNRSVVRKPSRDRRVLKRRIPRYSCSRENMRNTQIIDIFTFPTSSPEVDVSTHRSPGLFTIEEVRDANNKLIRDGNSLATNTGSRSKLIDEITIKLNKKINRKSINDAYFSVLETLKDEIL